MPILDLRRALLAAPVLILAAAAVYFAFGGSDGAGEIEAARLVPAGDSRTKVGLDPGNLAPDFELTTSQGHRLRLSELRGRPVMMNFWATWCGSCLAEMPEIKALQQQKGPDNFLVLAVNAGEGLAGARKFIDFLEAPFIYGLDPSLVVADAYGVYGLPLSVFIDAEGIVQASYNGHLQKQRLEAYANAAIDAKAPGAFPPTIQPISTIPRDRILYVTNSAAGRVEFASRSLRCDASYCVNDAIDVMKTATGVVSVEPDSSKPVPTLIVRYNYSTSEANVIASVSQAVEALKDPVYTTPLEVRRGKP